MIIVAAPDDRNRKDCLILEENKAAGAISG
jgi:hypothetical protein